MFLVKYIILKNFWKKNNYGDSFYHKTAVGEIKDA